MIKVKSYRPLITEHLIWDFPSRYTLKTVSQYLNQDVAQITDFISETAKETMSNTSVYWFIEDKKNHQIISLIAIKNIDFEHSSATLETTFDDNISSGFYEEIINRLFMLINEQLDLSELQVEKIPSNVTNFFTLNGYSLNNNKLKRK